ncbi:MAG: MSEP-CTERM sorting domain-containing protein [Bacillota bacterium]
MNRLYKPYILWLTVTIPQILIFVLFYRIFAFIGSELSEASVQIWMLLGSCLAVLCVVFTVYGIVSWMKKMDIHPFWSIGEFALYVIFLFIYFTQYTMIIPSTIPDWMLMGVSPGTLLLTLIMPALAHGMLVIVHWTIEKHSDKSIHKDVLFVIGIPLFWYFSIQLIHLGRSPLLDALEKVVPIVFIGSMAAFFFFFIRVIYMILRQKADIWQKYLTPFVLAGSLMGLALNEAMGDVFGDFSHYGYYVFAAITGTLILVPLVEDQRARLVLFAAKSITFVFTFYFFIVFLPYLPLAMFGLIVFGLGILMIVPLVLMLLHVRSLWVDFQYLKVFFTRRSLTAVFMLGIVLIPSVYVLAVGQDAEHVGEALRFTYQRSYEESSEGELNLPGIKRALTNIKYMNSRDRQRFGLITTRTPYLTSFYNWYVLDNLSISDQKIKRLEGIFFGEPIGDVDVWNGFEDSTNENIVIDKLQGETTFDEKEGTYKSWLHFELKNTSDFQSEFRTVFKLPEGSYISNYYLYVGDEKKYGMIADKRAVNWIYQQIKSVRRDPGILTYLGDDHIDFKVFPFAGKEIRKTGIEIIHKSPITLSIDQSEIRLADTPDRKSDQAQIISPHADVLYIPKEIKETLPKVTRDQRYYFILDYSKGNEDLTADYIKRVKDYMDNYSIESSAAEVIAVNYNEKRTTYDAAWERSFEKFPVKGGFYVDYTIKRIFYEHYVNRTLEQPVIVIVTDDLTKAILPEDFESFQFTSPESPAFYHLYKDGKLLRHSLLLSQQQSTDRRVTSVETSPVLRWKYNGKTFYLPDDHEDSIAILDKDSGLTEKDLRGMQWGDGVILEAMHMGLMLHPEKQTEKALAIVKGSIMGEVMSPLTSYIVLENEAQAKVMLEKQKQILSTDKPLDIGDFTEMDEPPLFIMVMLAVGFVLFIRWRKLQVE